MARYRVLSWHGIPSQVKALDEDGSSVSRLLPGAFQRRIDEEAMRLGLHGTDEYLDGWEWSAEREREGVAAEVADAVAAELAGEAA